MATRQKLTSNSDRMPIGEVRIKVPDLSADEKMNTPTGPTPTERKHDDTNPKLKKPLVRQLEESLNYANKSGELLKEDIPPSLCRPETMPQWRTVLMKNVYDHIRVIQLRWCAIQSFGVKLLVDGLSYSCRKSLEVLDLMGNEIGVTGSRSIAGLLAPGVDLDTFEVQDSRRMLASMENTSKIGRLHTLVLSYNAVSDSGCGYVGKALCLTHSLRVLELENCEIGDKGCKYLRRGIERNSTLRHINIAANRFGELGSIEIQCFLIRNSHMSSMDVSRNRMGPGGTMEIAKGMRGNKSLKKCRMNINRIGTRGAQVLAKILIQNHSLEELELSYNEIFNEGMQLIAQGLAQNHGLKRLVLWYNGLDDISATHLARALHQRTHLAHFPNEMIRAISFARPKEFYVLDSDGKPKQNSETYHICEIIVSYAPVYMYFELDISHNRRIQKSGINALLEVANTDNVIIKGMEQLLSQDRREREVAALKRTSLY